MMRSLSGKRRWQVGLAGLAAGMVVAGCSSAGSSSAPPNGSSGTAEASSTALTSVTISTASTSAGQSLVYLAQEQGLFAKNGINATVSTTAGSTLTAAVSGGSVDFGVFGAPQPETVGLQGAGVEWVMVWQKTANEQLVVGPGITSICQLKDKPVGFTTVGSLSEVFMEMALQKCNLTTSDVKLVPTQSNTQQSAAFASGQVAATVFGPPASSQAAASRQGAALLYNFVGKVAWPTAGLVVNKSYASSHSAVIEDVVKSLLQAVAVYKSNPAAAQKALNAENDNALSATALKTSYESALNYITQDAAPTLSLEQSTITSLRSLGSKFSYADPSKASTMIDASYVEKAAKDLNITLSQG